MTDICIICVNYNTPHLIEKLIQSYYNFGYNKYPLYIIDGSDGINLNKCINIYEKYNINYDMVGYNIHHGPGLDYLIKKLKYNYFLLIDSDAQFIKSGLIEIIYPKCLDKYGIGSIKKVDNNGINTNNKNNILYLHPRCALINKKEYLKYNPLIKHGAPFINAMKDIKAKDKTNLLINFNMDEYVLELSRGTVNLFGYNL